MSAASQNLIEIQSTLQDPTRVTTQDLMKYANGANPEVPSFLALIELNRRKQIEQTAQQFEQPQGTVKDQTINALMGRQQVNPAAAPQGINPAAMQRQVLPGQAPQGVNPAAQPVQAAEGGLMTIPVNNMFKAKNYATGGIVAFARGGQPEDRYVETPGGLNVLESELPEEERRPAYPERARYKLGSQEILGPRSQEEILAGLPAIAQMQGKRPGEMTPEQAYQREKEIQKLAGVSEDPYADVKKRQAEIEARQAEARKGDAIDRLLAQAEAFATADPTKGFGYQGAIASKASRTLEAEQRAIREKQDALNLDMARNMAKEEDARRRGDAGAVRSAMEQNKKDQHEYDKLQMEFDKLNMSRYETAGKIRANELAETKLPIDIFGAETQRRSSESLADYHRRMADISEATKPTSEETMFNKIMARVNQDPEIKALGGRLKDMDPGSEEYAMIQQAMYNKLKTYFAGHPEMLPPQPEQMLPTTPAKKGSSFEEWFRNAGSWGWMPGAKAAPPSQPKPAPITIPQGWTVQQNP